MFPLGVLSQAGLGGLVTRLFLNFNGTNNSNVFVDDSASNQTMTTVGTPIQFGGKGVFDGNGYIYTDTLPAFLDNDFLITGMFSISSWPGGFQDPAIFGYDDPITVQPLYLTIGAAGNGSYYKKLAFTIYDSQNLRHSITHQTDITLNVDHTFKVERSNGVVRLFLDEVEADTSYAIGTEIVISNGSRFCIGKGGSTLALYNGSVDQLEFKIAS